MKITIVYHGQESVREFEGDTVFVGRGTGAGAADLDLSPDVYVSRKHAVLTERHGAIWVEDLGSKLGTLVNSRQIQNQGEHRLRPGDAVLMGETTLRIEVPPSGEEDRVAAHIEPDAAADFHIEVALAATKPAYAATVKPDLELESRLAVLMDLADQVVTISNMDDLLQIALRKVMEVIPEAERGAVLLCGPNERELLVKACVSPERPAVSGTLSRRALDEGHGFIWRRNLAKELSGSIVQHRIATGIYVPLRCHARTLGVMCVDSPRIAAVFTQDDLRLMMAVSNYTALALRCQQPRSS